MRLQYWPGSWHLEGAAETGCCPYPQGHCLAERRGKTASSLSLHRFPQQVPEKRDFFDVLFMARRYLLHQRGMLVMSVAVNAGVNCCNPEVWIAIRLPANFGTIDPKVRMYHVSGTRLMLRPTFSGPKGEGRGGLVLRTYRKQSLREKEHNVSSPRLY